MKASGIRPAFAARDPVSDPNRWRRRQIAINKATDILKLLVEALLPLKMVPHLAQRAMASVFGPAICGSIVPTESLGPHAGN
jgi:hypothetical protein